MKSSELLKEYFEKKTYLFHGSSNGNIKFLEPRKVRGHDDSSDKFKNDKAVFASIEPSAPVLFSLIDWSRIPDDLAKGAEWGIEWKGINAFASLPIKWSDYLDKQKGYVYVLNKSGFQEKLGSQHKSVNPVTPVRVIEVQFSDFELLGGKLVWV